jgi:hypothetical protein
MQDVNIRQMVGGIQHAECIEGDKVKGTGKGQSF